jgi:hypothetical protein
MGMLDNLFKKKVKKIKKERDELKHLAEIKLNKLKTKRFSEKIFDEFIFIFRIFISKKLNIHKQTTHEELVSELGDRKIHRHIKNKIIKFSSKINEIEYRGIKITKEEFQILISELEEIIEII